MSHLLGVEGLTITSKKSKAMIAKQISFEVKSNQFTCIVGESGSGKTMISKGFLGLLDRKKFLIEGKVQYKGMDILKGHHLKQLIGRDIAYIPQNPMAAFNPSLKIGIQIVETIRTHRKVSKKEAYEIGVNALTNMTLPRPNHIMNAYPHTLSGGMLQRCMIAIALLFDPSLLIADEPTTAIDLKNQNTIMNAFFKLKENGLTSVFITHDFSVVSKIADYVVVMHKGEIVEKGETVHVLNAPKHQHTKELLNARLHIEGLSHGECIQSIKKI